MKLIIPLFCALALAGCQTSQPPGGELTTAVIIRTKVDENVAIAAKTLSDNCLLVRSGLGVANLFVKGETLRRRLAQASAAVESYCSGPPPADISAALLRLSAIYRDVMTAVPEARAHMPDAI